MLLVQYSLIRTVFNSGADTIVNVVIRDATLNHNRIKMSNIDDFGLLSDLITTSPTEANPILPKLNLNEAVTLSGSGDNGQKSLFEYHSEKNGLNIRRDELLEQRSKIKSNIDDLNVKLRQLQRKQVESSTNKKLKGLLAENDNFHTKQELVLSQDEELNKLDVSPLRDWTQRLKFIKKFCPYLEVDNINTSQFISGDLLLRVLEYVLISPLLFKIQFVITTVDNTISRLKIDYTQLSLLSTSLTTVFRQNYIPKMKLPLIMYSLNSLSILLHNRVSMFHKLLRGLRKYNTDEKFNELIQDGQISDNIKLFAILKLESYLNFSISVENSVVSFSFHWDIVLLNTVTGECESRLALYLSEGDRALDSNTLFLDLVELYGIGNAINIILKKSFDFDLGEYLK